MTVLFVHSSDTPLGAAANLIVASSSDQPDSGTFLAMILALAVGIGIVVGVMVLMTRAAHRRRTNSHPGLFSGLCQHHKLDRSRRNLLKALGQAHRVRYPARVFLDPTLFDPKRLPPALRSRADEILALRQQLFLAEDAPSPLQSSS